MMQAIAIDDEPLALEVVKLHAQKVPFLQLMATFTNPLDAAGFLQQHQVDLIFLDIKMPDISGLEFYQNLPQRPMVVFTTAYAEHAVTGFDLNAIDYLLKPFSLARFLKACTKAQELYQYRLVKPECAPTYIVLRVGQEQVRVNFDEILYAEATGNYITIVQETGKLLTRSTMTEAMQWLPPAQFVRIHRSYIVNVDKITRADREQVVVGTCTLPLGEAYSKALADKWK